MLAEGRGESEAAELRDKEAVVLIEELALGLGVGEAKGLAEKSEVGVAAADLLRMELALVLGQPEELREATADALSVGEAVLVG